MPTLSDAVEAVKVEAKRQMAQPSCLTIDKAAYAILRSQLAAQPTQGYSDSLSSIDDGLEHDRRIGLKLFFGVVNYCFTQPYTRISYEYASRKGTRLQRSAGFYAALAESFIDWSDPQTLLGISVSQWYQLLQTSNEQHLFQLDTRLSKLQRFADYCRQTSIQHISQLTEKYQTADQLFRWLMGSGLFEDVFLKRVQVTIAMLHRAVQQVDGHGYKDIHLLTLMADYRLPQLFYNMGVLKLEDSLLQRLNEFTVIEPNSSCEQELRSSVIVLGEQLAHELDVNTYELDKRLWEHTQFCLKWGGLAIPQMLVPTDAY